MRGTARRRLLVVLALGLVPWSVVVGPVTTFVFPAGLVEASTRVTFVPTWDLLFRYGGGLPRYEAALPLSIAFYLVALASAAAGLVALEDGRLTAAALVLSGVVHLGVPLAFAHRLRYVGLPVGALLLVAAAWWYYAGELRALFLAPTA